MTLLKRSVDVVVVGAGPGGSSAATYLARGGAHTLLLDQNAFPREKACGDGLMPEAVQLLIDIGIDIESLQAQIIRGVNLTVSGRGNRVYQFPPSELQGRAVTRFKLDDSLRKKALESGASFIGNAHVTGLIQRDGDVCGVSIRHRDQHEELIEAAYVIAADGSNSTLRKMACMNFDASVGYGVAARAYFVDIPYLDEYFHIYLPLAGDHQGARVSGYGWVFPLSSNRANIGVGFLTNTGTARQNLREVFSRFIVRLRASDQRFASMKQVGRVTGGRLQSSFDPASTIAPGLMFVGDAAGLVDPLTGEGIHSALESGRIAAEELIDTRGHGKRFPAHYAERLSQLYSERFRAGTRVQQGSVIAPYLLDEMLSSDRKVFSCLRESMLGFDTMRKGSLSRNTPTRDILTLHPEIASFLTDVEIAISKSFTNTPLLLLPTANRMVESLDRLSRVAVFWRASRFGMVQDFTAVVRAAAAVEVAYLGYQMHNSIVSERPRQDQTHIGSAKNSRKFADSISVMAGDLLLAKAYGLAAELGSAVSRILAHRSGSICAAEAAVDEKLFMQASAKESYLALFPKRKPAFHALACEIACFVAEVDPALRPGLLEFAQNVGNAYHLSAEVTELRDSDAAETHRLVASRLSADDWSLPMLMAFSKNQNTTPPSKTSADVLFPIVERVISALQSDGIFAAVLLKAEEYATTAIREAAAIDSAGIQHDMTQFASHLLNDLTPSAALAGNIYMRT